jgi:hypothetical protein
MTTITAPPELIQRLGRLDEKFEFRDAQGRLAGGCFSVPSRQEYVDPIDGVPFTEDEVRQMAEMPIEELTGRPSDEILKAFGASP